MLQLRDVPFVTLIGLLPFVLAACNDATSSSTDPRMQPPLVRIETVEISAQSERSFTGIVAARVQSDLGFRVPGKVLGRFVDAGQDVKRGQALMRIDPTDLRLAMRAHEEGVAAARARARQAADDEVRYRRLVSANFVSAAGYDKVKAAAEAARAELNAAEARADVARHAPHVRRLCRGRSSVPAKSSYVWRMPGAARRSSSFPKPCARRSDPPAG